MAAEDRRLSAARREVSLWNQDRRIGFRGSKGYGISRSLYHRAERRHAKKTCNVAPLVKTMVQRLWGETVYVHNVSDPTVW